MSTGVRRIPTVVTCFNVTGVYDLPFGRDGGSMSRLTGGWYVGGMFSATSGVPLECVPARRRCTAAGWRSRVAWARSRPTHSTRLFTRVSPARTASARRGNPATGGTGLNLFSDPAPVYNNFRRVLISQDRTSSRGTLYGLPRWNLDMSLGKRTRIAGRVNARLHGGDHQPLQHAAVRQRNLNLSSPTNFGVITSQANSARVIQLGFRVEF